MRLLAGTTDGIVDLERGDRYLAGHDIGHVVIDDDSWWAVDDTGGLWHGEERVAQTEDVSFKCVSPTPHAVWVGADSARLFRFDENGLNEDEVFAAAPGRERWHTPWGGPPDVRSMVFGPDGVLYVNVHVGGIVRYDDSGLSPTIDIESDVHQVVVQPEPPATVLAATAWGLAVSTDGHDFEIRDEGLAATYCRAVAVRNEVVVLSASHGPGGQDAGLYRADLHDGPLTRCTDGLPDSFDGNVDTHCLAAGSDGFAAGNGSTVWESANGHSWRVVADDLSPIRCLSA